jgi:hypothetical protein
VPALFHRLAIAQDVRLPIIDLRVTSMSLLNTGKKTRKKPKLIWRKINRDR